MPVDTLSLVWEASGNLDEPFEFPRTVRYGPEGRLYIVDAQSGRIFVYLPAGLLEHVYMASEGSTPFVAGLRGDTLLLFDPVMHRIEFVHEGRMVSHVAFPEPPSTAALQYAAGDPAWLYHKVLDVEATGFIGVFDDRGREHRRVTLPGPQWRHAGLLRVWGDTLLSLCAYRPVADLVLPGGGLDTLALVGFDSPMLARSRAFVAGEISEPPLLSPSAAPVGDRLFVLNLRPGWLRVDVFDRAGRLTHRLVQQDPAYREDFYPIDIDGRRTEDGAYELAVVFVKPEPHLSVFRWRPAD